MGVDNYKNIQLISSKKGITVNNLPDNISSSTFLIFDVDGPAT